MDDLTIVRLALIMHHHDVKGVIYGMTSRSLYLQYKSHQARWGQAYEVFNHGALLLTGVGQHLLLWHYVAVNITAIAHTVPYHISDHVNCETVAGEKEGINEEI